MVNTLWRQTGIFFFLLIFAAPLYAQEDNSESVYSIRAELYIRIGDYYASRQENKKAAVAYRQAAELAKQHLPSARQIAINQRLANVNDMAPAISNLKTQCDDQANDRDACLLLARYLSWHNQPIAASKIGGQLLQIDRDNRDVLITQANALSWQGDAAGALLHYEALVRSDNSFYLVLAYSRALLATGNLAAAHLSRTYLDANSELEKVALEDLDWALKSSATTRMHYSHENYGDNFDAHYQRRFLGLDVALDDAWLWLRYGKSSSGDYFGDIGLDQIQLGGQARLHDRVYISALLGQVSYSDLNVDSVTVANINLASRLQKTRIELSLSRELIDESPLALEYSITRQETELLLQHQLSDQWGLNFSINSTDYSDNNHSIETVMSAMYSLYFGPPKIDIGVKRETLAFDRQSGGGYFDPDRMATTKLLATISQYRERFSANLEVFVGRQAASRLGYRQSNQIVGGYAALRYQLSESLLFELSWEGGHFALNQPDAYRYNLISAKGYVFF